MNPDQLCVTASADASYGIHADGKGQTGIAISFGTGVINASTSKQKLDAKSSSESELIAASDGVSNLMRFNNYLKSRSYKVKELKLLQDNMST